MEVTGSSQTETSRGVPGHSRMPPRPWPLLTLLLPISIAGATLVLMLLPLFSTSRLPGFRDSGHFYIPLYHWIANETKQRELPLWNPTENSGLPLAADPTAALFYPGKLLFLCGLKYEFAFNTYLIVHIFLAACGAYLVARECGCRRESRPLAALTYAGSGFVLFQCYNVVYLVGAAWLPWGLAFLFRARKSNQLRDWTLSAGAAAMCCLGGDPQMTYHLLLIGLACILVPIAIQSWSVTGSFSRWTSSIQPREEQRTPSPDQPFGFRLVTNVFKSRREVLLAGFWCLAILALSAVQLIPSLQYASQSDRALRMYPRSVWEVGSEFTTFDDIPPQTKWDESVAGLLGVPEPGTHHDHIFQFSLAPWTLTDLVLPNSNGRTFPTHQRWSSLFPASDRTWASNLYMGALVLPLFLSLNLRFEKRDALRPLLIAGFLFGIGSFGWYGLGWLGLEVGNWFGYSPSREKSIGPQVGGLYWLMTTFLPGYVQFRFPAKLFVVTTLALAVGSARSLDDLSQRIPRRLPILLLSLAAISALALIASFLFAGSLSARAAESVDATFGPLDSERFLAIFRTGAVGTFFASAIALSLVSLYAKSLCSFRTLSYSLLVVAAVDIAWANRHELKTVDSTLWHLAEGRVDNSDLSKGSFRLFRAHYDQLTPLHWSEVSNAERIEEILNFDYVTRFPKHHFSRGEHLAESYGSNSPRYFSLLTQSARFRGFDRGDGVREPAIDWLRLVGCKTLLFPDFSRESLLEVAPNLAVIRSLKVDGDFEMLELDDSKAHSRAWLVPAWGKAPAWDGFNLSDGWEWADSILLSKGEPRDFHRDVLIHPSREWGFPPESLLRNGSKTVESHDVIWLSESPNEVRLRLACEAPMMLVLSDNYDENWKAYLVEAETSDAYLVRTPVWRANGSMRSVAVPPGTHDVVFRYIPESYQWGSAISIVSLIACTILLIAGRRATCEVDSASLSQIPPN